MGTQKTSLNNLLGLYIHWPYCIHKCPYCDFASTTCDNIDEQLLLQTYVRDMNFFPSSRPLSSIFFGGGTPSLMPLSFLEKLIKEIHNHYQLTSDVEISLEANPDTVNKNKLQEFKDLGVNRLSIGVQALNQKDLKFLGRTHTLQRALQCIEEAKQLWNNINIDLIYARPHQSLKAWEKELKTALQFELPHYSLYQLTIEENTPFHQQGQQPATETQARRLYKLTDSIMNDACRPAYEVSNYALRGFECRHNLAYWLGQDYIGIGPAAHGRQGLLATQNARWVASWVKNNPQIEKLTPEQKKLETLLMGLRLRQHPFSADDLNPINIQKALQKKWILKKGNNIYPTQAGILMLNQLILLLMD